jgi:peptidoglycan/LPS O-acetylase OafA/YrhL
MSGRMLTVKDAFERGGNNFHLLRLLAALAVIYGHSYHITSQPGGDLFLMTVGFKFIGGVAVNMFFVISGFLICGSLERNSVGEYLAARCLRIFPALIVVVLLSVLVLGPLLTTDAGYWTNSQTWRYLFNNASMWKTEYFLPGVFIGNPDHAVNGSLWSLAVEFRLYLLFLLLSALGLLRRDVFTALCVFALLAGLWAMPRYPILTQYINWVEVTAYFFAGALIWKRRDEVLLTPWGVFVVIGLCVLFHGTPQFYITFFVALIYLTFYLGFLDVRWLPKIRRRDLSYGVYLYGWPVQQVVVMLVPGQSAMFNTVVSCACALILAFLSWQLIENPALKLKKRR